MPKHVDHNSRHKKELQTKQTVLLLRVAFCQKAGIYAMKKTKKVRRYYKTKTGCFHTPSPYCHSPRSALPWWTKPHSVFSTGSQRENVVNDSRLVDASSPTRTTKTRRPTRARQEASDTEDNNRGTTPRAPPKFTQEAHCCWAKPIRSMLFGGVGDRPSVFRVSLLSPMKHDV